MAKKKKGLLARLMDVSADQPDEVTERDVDRDEILAQGLDGTATVLENHRAKYEKDHGFAPLGRSKDALHAYVLRIQVSDRRPAYELSGRWRIPDYSNGRDWIGMLQPTMTIPVKVLSDEPERVAIDWDAFEAGGGEKTLRDAWQQSHGAPGSVSVEATQPTGADDDMPPDKASPREMLEWQLRKGHVDQATYDSIIAANPKLK